MDRIYSRFGQRCTDVCVAARWPRRGHDAAGFTSGVPTLMLSCAMRRQPNPRRAMELADFAKVPGYWRTAHPDP